MDSCKHILSSVTYTHTQRTNRKRMYVSDFLRTIALHAERKGFEFCLLVMFWYTEASSLGMLIQLIWLNDSFESSVRQTLYLPRPSLIATVGSVCPVELTYIRKKKVLCRSTPFREVAGPINLAVKSGKCYITFWHSICPPHEIPDGWNRRNHMLDFL